MTDYQLATLRDIRARTSALDHHTDAQLVSAYAQWSEEHYASAWADLSYHPDDLGLFIAWALGQSW
jgi:hypothetical protein